MRKGFNTSPDPELFYNGGYRDHEDDLLDSDSPDIHLFSPFLFDESAVLDTYSLNDNTDVRRDPNPPADTWVDRRDLDRGVIR